MKTKILFFLFCSFFFLQSCGSAQEEKNNGSVVLTDKNFIYEGDLRKFYLNHEIDNLEIKIKELQEIINNNQGDKDVKKQLDQLVAQKENYQTQIENTADLKSLRIRARPIPIPPKPLPCDCLIQYIIFENNRDIVGVSYLNKETKLLGSTMGKANKLPNSEVKYLDFKDSSFTIEDEGSFQIKSGNGSYTVNLVEN
ncbi:MAG TPA: hypothetical protein ENH91_07375 [Leeuwenhoekiella sp.]|nr:hypothetical protein [Leeuwenhoekiella sp.]